jgi:hypothetical protein
MEVLMKKSLTTISWIAILAVFLSACNLGVNATPDGAATLNPLYTAAAQTLQAMVTEQASMTPVSVVATSTLVPVANSHIVISHIYGLCRTCSGQAL